MESLRQGLRTFVALGRCLMASFRSPKERRVAMKLWTTDLAWQYQVRVDLGGEEWIRVDFFHPNRKEIIEVRSSGETLKHSIMRLSSLRKMGYSVRVISDPREIGRDVLWI